MSETGAWVPQSPLVIPQSGVVVGRTVRAARWRTMAEQANYLLGRGRTLIPDSTIDQVCTPGAKVDLRFRVLPAYQATKRRWRYAVTTTGTTGFARFEFIDASGTSHLHSLGYAGTHYLYADEEISSRTAAEDELVVKFWTDAASTLSMTIEALGCFEVPRPDLALGSPEYGVQLADFDPLKPIYDSSGRSFGGVADAHAEAWATAGRAGLFAFARHSPGISTTSTSPVAIFGAPPVILGRKEHRASTTRTVLVRARCSASPSASGEVSVKMTSGASASLIITTGMAPTWLEASIDVDCEDNDVADGRRSARDDKATWEWKRSGSGTIYMESAVMIDG